MMNRSDTVSIASWPPTPPRLLRSRRYRCDILINCAGIFPNQPFDEMTFADWRRVLAINLDSVFLMSAAFAPAMKQRQWGRIVNMASSTLGSPDANTVMRPRPEM